MIEIYLTHERNVEFAAALDAQNRRQPPTETVTACRVEERHHLVLNVHGTQVTSSATVLFAVSSGVSVGDRVYNGGRWCAIIAISKPESIDDPYIVAHLA